MGTGLAARAVFGASDVSLPAPPAERALSLAADTVEQAGSGRQAADRTSAEDLVPLDALPQMRLWLAGKSRAPMAAPENIGLEHLGGGAEA